MVENKEIRLVDFFAKQTALNELQLLSLKLPPKTELPLISVGIIAAGCVFLAFSLGDSGSSQLFGQLGATFLILALLTLPSELLFKRAQAKRELAKLRPFLDYLRELKVAIGEYLSELDQRTSRYFHCVTDSKVTAYFMLRQIEAAINNELSQLEECIQRPSLQEFHRAYERLRGDLEYRDGFEFNAGQLHKVAVVKLPSTVRELAHSLEKGVIELEEEIKLCRDSLTNSEPQD